MNTNNICSFQQNGKGNGVTYGYIRVSTVAQHDDRQRIAMEEFGITADYVVKKVSQSLNVSKYILGRLNK